MSVRIVFNHLPKVIADLHDQVDKAVDDTADEIGKIAEALVPKDTLILLRTTKSKTPGDLHAAIESGIYRGHGFYAGFQEYGTRHHGAQPYMTPAAHQGEAILVQKTTEAVKRACDV